MGLNRRPKTGRKFDGSKLIVDNNAIKTVQFEAQRIPEFIFEDPGPGLTQRPTPTVTPTNSATPLSPTPQETPTNTPTLSRTPRVTPTPTKSIRATATPTRTPKSSSTPTKSIQASPTPTKSVQSTPDKTPTPTRTPRQTKSPTVSPTPTETPPKSKTPTPTKTPSPTPSPTQTESNLPTPTNTRTNTQTPTKTKTPTVTPTHTPTTSPSPTVEPTQSVTATETPTVTPTVTPTTSLNATPSVTKTATITASITKTPRQTGSPTRTPVATRTPRGSESSTPTNTPTPTLTPTFTPSNTLTPTVTRTSNPCSCYSITNNSENESAVFFYRNCSGNNANGSVGPPTDTFLGVAYVCGNDVVADSIATVVLVGPCGAGNSCPSGPIPSRTPTKTPGVTSTPTNTPIPSQSPTVTLSITNSVSASPPCERPLGLGDNIVYLIPGWFAGPNYTGTFTPIQNLTLQAACNQWLNYSADEDSSAQAIILLYSSFSVDGYLYPPYSQSSNTCDCGITNGTYWINYAFPGLAPSKSDPISLIVVTNCVIRLIADCDNLPAESPTPTITSTVTSTPTVTPTLTPGFSPTPAASSTPEVSPTVTKTPNCVPPVGLYPYTWVFAWSDGINNYDFQNTSVNNACNEFVNYLAETSSTFISTVSFFSLSNDTVVVGATIYGREDSCDCPPELNGYFWVNDDNIRKPANSITTSLSIVYVENCIIQSITPCYPLVSPAPTPSFTVTPTVTPTTPGNCDCVTLVLFDINTNKEVTFILTPDLSNPSFLSDGTITYIYLDSSGTVYTFFKENNGWLLYYNDTPIYLATPDISDCPSSATDWQLLNDIKIRFVSISAGPCGDPTPTPTETPTPTPTPECDKTGFDTTIYIAYQLWDGPVPGPPNAPYNFQSFSISMEGACNYYRPAPGQPLGGPNWASHPDWSIYTDITAKVSGYTGGGGAALLGLIITGSDDTRCGCGYINQGQFWVNRIDPTVPPTIDSGVVVVRFDKFTCEINQVLDCGAGAPVSPAPTSTPAPTPSPEAFNYNVEYVCQCPISVNAGLNTVTGGVPPYLTYLGVFNSEAAALANTNWSTNIDFSIGIGSCGVTNGNTYWFVAKDANNTILAKSITINCTSFAICDPWLLAGSGRNVYVYNRVSNTVTQLTQFNINTSTDIAHTDTRVWFSQGTTIQQFDYVLNPFSVGTLTNLTSPDVLGNGLVALDNGTLIGTRKNGAIDEIIRINLPVGASTTTTNLFFANSGMIDIKDLAISDTGYLIATGFGTSTSDPVVKEWNISTGNPNPIVSVNITPSTFVPMGHYINLGTLYIVNSTTSESWKQFQDFSWSISNTNIFIPLTNILGISQIRSCFTQYLVPTAPAQTMRVGSIAGTTMEINLETSNSGVAGWDSVTMGVTWGDGGTNSYSANFGQELLDTLTNTPQTQTFSITHPYNLNTNADITFAVIGATQPPPLPFYSLSLKRISSINTGSFRDMFSSTDGTKGLLQMWFISCTFQTLDIDAPRRLQQLNISNHGSSILNIGFNDGLLGNFNTIRQIRFLGSTTVTSLNQDFRGTLLDWISGDANIFALDVRSYSVCTTVTFKLPFTITRLGFTDMASLATINLSTVTSSGINGLIGTVLTYIQVREVLQLTSWTYLLPSTMVTFSFFLNRASNTTGGVSSFTINLANNTTNLQSLRMDGNRMSTFNPANLSSCNGLLALNLYDNLLTTIPTLPSNLTSLNISGNRLTIRPTSLPSSLVTLIMGGSPNLGLNNPNVANSDTNNNKFGSQFNSVTDTYFSSMSNLTSLKMRNLGLTEFNSPVPSNTLNFLDISSGGPAADANNIPIIRFQSFPNVRDLYAFKIGATTLSGISSTTRLEYLLVGENAFTNQNDFFQPNPSTTFFPSTLKTLLMYNNNIVNWSKNLFGTTGVLSIESVNMQGCSFNATSINYILNYFAGLKSAGRVPNLFQINLSNLQGSPTPNPNSPPDTTSGGINGCSALNTLRNATSPTVEVIVVTGGPCP